MKDRGPAGWPLAAPCCHLVAPHCAARALSGSRSRAGTSQRQSPFSMTASFSTSAPALKPQTIQEMDLYPLNTGLQGAPPLAGSLHLWSASPTKVTCPKMSTCHSVPGTFSFQTLFTAPSPVAQNGPSGSFKRLLCAHDHVLRIPGSAPPPTRAPAEAGPSGLPILGTIAVLTALLESAPFHTSRPSSSLPHPTLFLERHDINPPRDIPTPHDNPS